MFEETLIGGSWEMSEKRKKKKKKKKKKKEKPWAWLRPVVN